MGLCVVSHSSLASCTFPTTLWLFKKKKHLQWNHDMHLKITFCSPHLHPGSSMLTAGITIHYVSAGKGCRGPGRSSHHISLSGPVGEIITCTDKLPRSYFYIFFFYCTFFYKTGRCLETTNPGFRTHVLFLVTYLKSRSCSLSTFGGFFQGPSLYSLIHHCHQLQGKKSCSWRMEDREAISHPFRYPPWYLISSWMVVNGERPFLVTWRLYDVLQLESRSLSKISRSTNLLCGKRLSELNLLCHTMLGWGTNHHKSDCVS